MNASHLAWLQLIRTPARFVTAISGVAVAVVLMLMQLGFKDALFVSAVRLYDELAYDVILVSPKTTFVVRSVPFARRRLFQARSVSGVASVTPVYTSGALFRDPARGISRQLFVIGVDPEGWAFSNGIQGLREGIKHVDDVYFDVSSRPAYGPIVPALERGERPQIEVNGSRLRVVEGFGLGTSFGIDGSILTSDETFSRLVPNRTLGQIDFGLVRARPGIAPSQLADRIRTILPDDVEVLTREEIVAREQAYWANTTPIGHVFAFGTVMGVVVGAIIVYQILYSGVTESLPRYATLRATGYPNGYLVRIIATQGAILAIGGFAPGLYIASLLYGVAGRATRLPLDLTSTRALAVFVLTLAMCTGSALFAARRLRAADPAELF